MGRLALLELGLASPHAGRRGSPGAAGERSPRGPRGARTGSRRPALHLRADAVPGGVRARLGRALRPGRRRSGRVRDRGCRQRRVPRHGGPREARQRGTRGGGGLHRGTGRTWARCRRASTTAAHRLVAGRAGSRASRVEDRGRERAFDPSRRASRVRSRGGAPLGPLQAGLAGGHRRLLAVGDGRVDAWRRST